RRHTSWPHDWSSDVCSSDLGLDHKLPSKWHLNKGLSNRNGVKYLLGKKQSLINNVGFKDKIYNNKQFRDANHIRICILILLTIKIGRASCRERDEVTLPVGT